ncbi:MAG: class I SAM-dependent methyltransferase [Betaproteobacteria bacterium]|nr:class I SAM-dependent methyltransferase [Betaproteobacteria bacterium]
MKASWNWLGAALLALALATAAGQASAQKRAGTEFEPQVGQAGKDVIWVPTPLEVVDKMLTMTQTTANDFVVDLGSGDGRTVIQAAKKYGARALGIEYNPDMVTVSSRAAQKEGVADKVKFMKADIFETDFTQATVITLYLLPDLNLKLRPKILDMKPGTRVASHQFTMGDWQPDETAHLDNRQALFWIVPAKVGGTWRLRGDGVAQDTEMTIKQTFQLIQGNLKSNTRELPLTATNLRGSQISFSTYEGSVRRDYSGRVSDNVMEGTVRSGGGPEGKWRATRQ